LANCRTLSGDTSFASTHAVNARRMWSTVGRPLTRRHALTALKSPARVARCSASAELLPRDFPSVWVDLVELFELGLCPLVEFHISTIVAGPTKTARAAKTDHTAITASIRGRPSIRRLARS
jgi:hypothetical protein